MSNKKERTCCSVCMTFQPKSMVLVVMINHKATNICLECMHSINHAFNLGIFASELDTLE